MEIIEVVERPALPALEVCGSASGPIGFPWTDPTHESIPGGTMDCDRPTLSCTIRRRNRHSFRVVVATVKCKHLPHQSTQINDLTVTTIVVDNCSEITSLRGMQMQFQDVTRPKACDQVPMQGLRKPGSSTPLCRHQIGRSRPFSTSRPMERDS